MAAPQIPIPDIARTVSAATSAAAKGVDEGIKQQLPQAKIAAATSAAAGSAGNTLVGAVEQNNLHQAMGKALGDSFGGGGSGFSIGGALDWVDHTATTAGNVVGNVTSHIPGVAPITGALNRVYTDVISHPLSTAITGMNQAFQEGGAGMPHFQDILNPGKWTQAWQASNHISPGQAVIAGLNNSLAEDKVHGVTAVNPDSPSEIQGLMGRNSLAALTSGTIDGVVRFTLDPTALGAKVAGGKFAELKNAPVRAGMDGDAIVASNGGQRFINQVAGAKSFSEVQKIKAVQATPVSYTLASLLHSAGGDTTKISEILKVASGDSSALDRLAQDSKTLGTLAKPAGDVAPEATSTVGGMDTLALHKNLPAVQSTDGRLVAMRASSSLMPPDVTLKSALSDMDPAQLDEWFKNPAQIKTAHAQLVIQDKMAELDAYQAIAGSMLNRTTGDLGLHLAGKKAGMALASRTPGSFTDSVLHGPGSIAQKLSPTTLVQNVVSHVSDPIVRIYHTVTDARPTGMVDFGDTGSVRQVRSFLNTSSVLSPATKDGMLADYAKALTRGKAEAQSSFSKIEQEVKSQTAQHFGLGPEHGDAIYHEFAARRNLHIGSITAKDYGTLKGPNGADWGAVFPTHDYSQVVTDPYVETQLKNGAIPFANMRDYELALKRMQDSGLLAHVHALGEKGHGVLIDGLDKFYGIFKPLVMLTGHRAFNHVGDDSLRSMTKMGALATTRSAAGGMANFIRNRTAPLTKGMIVHNLEGKWDQDVLSAAAEYKGFRSRYMDQQQRLSNGEEFAPENLIDSSSVARSKENLDNLKTNPPQYIQNKHRLGDGTFTVKGTGVKYPEIFGGPDGALLRKETSADKSFDEMFNKTAVNDFNSQGTLADSKVVGPIDGQKTHGKAIIDYVNDQLKTDSVAKMMYAGKSDADIADWMLNSAPGRARMRAMHIGNPADNIEMVRDAMNRYLPTQDAKAVAFTGKYDDKALKRTWPNAAARPPVSSVVNDLTHTGTKSASYIRNAATSIIKMTGSLPDDVLVRHPMANALYKTNFTRLVENKAAQGVDVPLGSDVYDSLHKMAIQQTKSTMQKTLYDSSRFVGAGASLRFAIPFFSAWHNAMTSWSHLIAQNPQLIVRGLEMKHALWNAPFAVDASTGQKSSDSTSLDNLSFVMHLPKGLAKSLGMGDLSNLTVGAKTVVSPTYADAVGNPGFGPLVQIPVNHLVKENPSLMKNSFVEQILGGRVTSNDLSSAIPSVATEALDLAGMGGVTGQPDDVASRASLKWTLYQEQYYDYLSGHRSAPPNWDDISSQASWLSAISGIANRLSPLGFKPQDQYKFLTDAYQQMYAQDPQHADENFYDKYGTAGWIYTQSLGKNVAGVAPTLGAIEAYKANQSLISQHPELGAVVVGPNGDGSFNQEAYNWEVAMGLRTKMSPEAAAKQAQTNLGWTEYNKINANIQAQLQKRGLTTVNQNGAEDLKSLKSQFISATGNPQSKYYNPDFYGAFGSFDQNTYQNRITALGKVAQDQTLLSNPLRSDIKSLNAYMQIRDTVHTALQSRSSKSITAKSNYDIAQYLDAQVGKLAAADTKFGPLYERYLAKDNFKEPN